MNDMDLFKVCGIDNLINRKNIEVPYTNATDKKVLFFTYYL